MGDSGAGNPAGTQHLGPMQHSQAATSISQGHTAIARKKGSCWEMMREDRLKPKTPLLHRAHEGNPAKCRRHPNPCKAKGSCPLGVPLRLTGSFWVLPCHRANSHNPLHCSHSETFVSNMAPRICVLFPVNAKAGEQQRWGAAAWL